MPCLFCQIAEKKLPAKIVFENEAALAFLDINPRSKGHTVVAPMVHAETISDLPSEYDSELLAAVRETIERLKALSPDGFTIGVNQGKISGQEVPHLHIHIIPRYKDDGGSSIQSVVPAKSDKDTAAVWDIITKGLK